MSRYSLVVVKNSRLYIVSLAEFYLVKFFFVISHIVFRFFESLRIHVVFKFNIVIVSSFCLRHVYN